MAHPEEWLLPVFDTDVVPTSNSVWTELRPAVLAFVALLAGCQFSENRYLAREVSSSELIKNWRATEFAIKSLRDVGVRDHLTVREHTIELRADGSCALRTIMNMPPFRDAHYRDVRRRLSMDARRRGRAPGPPI